MFDNNNNNYKEKLVNIGHFWTHLLATNNENRIRDISQYFFFTVDSSKITKQNSCFFSNSLA